MSNPSFPQDIQTATFEAALAEAMAHSKYELFASFCEDLGYYGASLMFKKLADNEKEHLEQLMDKLKVLYKDDIETMLRTTLMGELNDANVLYPKLNTMIGDYQGRGNQELGDLQTFAMRLSMIETHHTNLIKEALHEIKPDEYPEHPHKEYWVCQHCGMIYEDYKDIPEKCPVCQHDRADYVLQ